MNQWMRISLAAVLVGAFAVAAVAQRGPGNAPGAGPGQGPGFGPGGPMQRRGGNAAMMLLQMKSVQAELKLSAEQLEKLGHLQPPRNAPGGAGRPGGQGPAAGPGGPPQGGQRGPGGPPQGGPGGGQRGPGGPPPGGAGMGGPGGELPPHVAEILTDGQEKRLRQLGIQFHAPMTLLDPAHSKELKLSEEQREQLHQVIGEAMPRPPMPPQPGQGGQPGRAPEPIKFSEMQAKKAAALKAALKVLTAEQREAWSRLTGPTFDRWEEPRRPNG